MKQALLTALQELAGSKKAWAAVTAIVVAVAGRFGFHIDPTILDRIDLILVAYLGAQGLADNGKSSAQILAAKPVASAALNAPTGDTK